MDALDWKAVRKAFLVWLFWKRTLERERERERESFSVFGLLQLFALVRKRIST